MKIDSGHSGYQYPNRTQAPERKTEEAQQSETQKVSRSPNAITGSSTLFSTSLAKALWVMEAADANTPEVQAPALSQDWVESRYQEFADA
ncbi:hypothetical protein M0654_10835 [Rhizobium sp. NTR19]|uniref:Uncharacterized protein n=1 Tax=Neorhizobium turbinariae TaxID=2937795 RepID=A0ABT0IRI2_9HYPH|nr:hypothetical protein [Neorhizobium turbinariae]MCK8780480.1 hypothetical protein [Neorhizobium turbinariae]